MEYWGNRENTTVNQSLALAFCLCLRRHTYPKLCCITDQLPGSQAFFRLAGLLRGFDGWGWFAGHHYIYSKRDTANTCNLKEGGRQEPMARQRYASIPGVPAKRVMLIWGAVGGGHQSGMSAIRDALSELDPAVEIIDVDVYSRPWSYFPLTLAPRLYAFIVDRMPWVWSLICQLADSQRGSRLIEQMTACLFSPVFEEPLRCFRPDVVVCVIHSISGGLKRALRIVGQNPRIGIVVQDMVTVPHTWLVPDAAWLAMPTREACKVATDSGLPLNKLHLVGMPLRRMFWGPAPDRVTLRQQLGLPESGTIILMIGGTGVHRFKSIVTELLRADVHGHIAIVAVEDKPTRQWLDRKSEGRSISVVGRVSNISEWMWASDVLITKAGPNAIYEAMCCQLPVILIDAIPGQETGNLWFVERYGIGLVTNHPAQIADAAKRILSEPGLADGMKTAMQRICVTDAAQQVAELILDV